MVAVASNDFNSQKYIARPGLGFDGVVLVDAGKTYGSGALLWDGLHILTAAHVVKDTDAKILDIQFETTEGRFTAKAAEIITHPDYDSYYMDNDLALISLTSPAPIHADRYQLYRENDEPGMNFSFAGYGKPGTGISGTNGSVSDFVRRGAANTFDSSLQHLKSLNPGSIDWSIFSDRQLIADFDNGRIVNDSGYQFMNISHTGLLSYEGLPTPGDSGGPAFIDGEISGITSYIFNMNDGSKKTDVDDLLNSSYGEFASWQRISSYEKWIDQTVRNDYLNAPVKASDVKKYVSEGAEGFSMAWFLVELNGPGAEEGGSVLYRTVDGSAREGEDYIAAYGRLVFYPGETHVAIPVEIIGDSRLEGDEFFYMEIYDPSGGVFPGGKNVLSAMRTIVDDDYPIRLTGVCDTDLSQSFGA